ncbi:hypothetical protein B0H19DRAFT_1074649 [Mycena capillaripes]|nr:hypothetical protein B0H19DRAFT_1074649 [Mycena capillaripes]
MWASNAAPESSRATAARGALGGSGLRVGAQGSGDARHTTSASARACTSLPSTIYLISPARTAAGRWGRASVPSGMALGLFASKRGVGRRRTRAVETREGGVRMKCAGACHCLYGWDSAPLSSPAPGRLRMRKMRELALDFSEYGRRARVCVSVWRHKAKWRRCGRMGKGTVSRSTARVRGVSQVRAAGLYRPDSRFVPVHRFQNGCIEVKPFLSNIIAEPIFHAS